MLPSGVVKIIKSAKALPPGPPSPPEYPSLSVHKRTKIIAVFRR
jgi:hypothetical protein